MQSNYFVFFLCSVLLFSLLAYLQMNSAAWSLLDYLCYPNDFFGFSDQQSVLLGVFQLRSLLLESLSRVVILFPLFGAVGLMTSLMTLCCTPLRPMGRDMAGPAGSADHGQQLSRLRSGREFFTHDDDASILVRSG